jgi:large subunit ribosomal protein L35
MPKKKTNKAAAKRFKKTATGKIKYNKAGSGHLLSSKSRKRKRNLRGGSILSKPECKRITGMLAG